MSIVTCGFVLAAVLVVSGLVFRRPSDTVRPGAPAGPGVSPSPLYAPVLGLLILALLVLLGGAILPGIHWDALAAWLRGDL